MAAQHKMEDGTKRVLDKLVSRRKMKKSYEYEVQWKNCTPDQNTYIVRDKCAPACSQHLCCPPKFLCILTCYAWLSRASMIYCAIAGNSGTGGRSLGCSNSNDVAALADAYVALIVQQWWG